MKEKQLRAFKYFDLELKSLASFLIVTNPYLQGLSSRNLWEIDTVDAEKARVEGLLCFKPVTNDFIARSFEQNIPFLSRELLYIRIVSALEVFLVQSVRDVFKQTTKPFESNIKKMELNHSQILSFTTIRELRNLLLHKETRPLSSAGYEDVVKYYKQQLEVDISSLGPGLNKMKYYHEIRHILVHRLGKVDKHFKHQYGFKKTYLQIDESLLFELFNDVYTYASLVSEKVSSLINTHSNIEVYKEFIGQRLRIEFDSKISDKVNFLEPEYNFWVGDEIYHLADLGMNIISKGSHYIIEVWAAPDILKAYKRSIKTRLETSKYFENINIYPVAQPTIFDESIILAVSKLLPEGIWQKGTRKQIASRLGLSNNMVDKLSLYLILVAYISNRSS